MKKRLFRRMHRFRVAKTCTTNQATPYPGISRCCHSKHSRSLLDSELSFTSRSLPSLAFVSLGDWSNGASRSALPEKPGKEIEDNPGFHAGDKLILERKGEGKCDVQAAFNQSRVSASLNNVRPVDLGRGSLLFDTTVK